jgi:hypothetical protein
MTNLAEGFRIIFSVFSVNLGLKINGEIFELNKLIDLSTAEMTERAIALCISLSDFNSFMKKIIHCIQNDKRDEAID